MRRAFLKRKLSPQRENMAPLASPVEQGTLSSPSNKYRPEIDGLRAFAVIVVIINHFSEDLLPSGYLGVDIFFVISGYVITSSLTGRESNNFLEFLSAFYERRIKRLVPALVCFVLVTSVLICLFNPNPEVALRTGLLSLFGGSNLYLLRASTDYFAQSTWLNPFVHTWSLGVEEQFYILFPFLIWFSGYGRQATSGARNLCCWLAALCFASLTGFVYLYKFNQPAAYFLMPTRFWEMAAGCLVFIGFQKRPRIEKALEQVPPVLVLAAMAGVMFLPLSAAALATIGIVLLSSVLMACLKNGSRAYHFFTRGKVVYIGLISYSLYLWHWPVLSISRWTIGIHWWSVPLQIAVIFFLAILSYRFVEYPIRKKRDCPMSQAIIISGASAAIISAVFVKLVSSYHGYLYSGLSERGRHIYSENDRWNHKSCVRDRRNESVPALYNFSDCFLGPRNKLKLFKTVPTIFWYGNSFNEQLMPAAAKMQLTSGLQMNSFAVTGCPATLNMEYADEKVAGYCAKSFRKYIDFVLNYGTVGSKLIVAASPEYWSGHADRASMFRLNGSPLTNDKAQALYKEELINLSVILAKKGMRLIVTTGVPSLAADPDICSNIGSQYNDICNYAPDSAVHDMNESFVVMLRAASVRSNNLQVLDIYSPLAKRIRGGNQGVYALYYNSTHISQSGAIFLVPTLSSAIGLDM
jgi:peptidoglycan/LPS O-acetylase OafA/YrhL